LSLQDYLIGLLDHPKVIETRDHMHHSLSKHDHLHRTARISFRLARLLRANVRICVRAAMIHDIDSRLGTLTTHGRIAARWAASVGECENVCHAIEAHMYPFGPKPRTREAWVVSLADKAASLTDITVMLGGMMTGRTWRRRRALCATDPHFATRRVRRRHRRRPTI
jgi:glycyl-tRNA synthetase beta chain